MYVNIVNFKLVKKLENMLFIIIVYINSSIVLTEDPLFSSCLMYINVVTLAV